MNAVAQVLAVLQALSLIGVGVLEAFFHRDPRFYSLFRIKPEHHAAVRLWVINVGFYNIVFGLAGLVGVVLLNVDATVGRTLVFMVCASHVILGGVLVASEPKLWRGALFQSVLPLIVIVVALVWP